MVEQPMPTEGKIDVSPLVEQELKDVLQFWDNGVADFIIGRFRERTKKGLETYGTPLQTHNGRDALLDAIDEVLDMCQYLMQSLIELGDEGNCSRRTCLRSLFKNALNLLVITVECYLKYGQDVVKQADTRTT